MTKLFDPITVGDLHLPNRIIMAPLTRLRTTGGEHVPNDTMARYYRQRADAGLIISEAVPVSPQALGYAHVPGVWTEAQTEGWKKVTRAVHEAGGRIFMQIWHVGRISDPQFHNGQPPVAPSAIAPQGFVSLLRPKRAFSVPRALATEEIPGVVDSYRRAAENAQRAGFDGVEIHGANGYLIDQFLQDGSNHRDDGYGGPLENRARLMLEITDAVISVWGANRVGMHIAPRADSHSMGDSNLAGTFEYVARELGKRRIAFLFAREYEAPDSLGPRLKKAFGGVYVANEKFTLDSANAILARGDADAVSFGKAFIANPDLVERLRQGAALNELVLTTMYGTGEEQDLDLGYNDYPSLAELAQQPAATA